LLGRRNQRHGRTLKEGAELREVAHMDAVNEQHGIRALEALRGRARLERRLPQPRAQVKEVQLRHERALGARRAREPAAQSAHIIVKRHQHGLGKEEALEDGAIGVLGLDGERVVAELEVACGGG